MRTRAARAALLALLVLAAPCSLAAQDGFFFGPPRGTLSLRAGLAQPSVGGDMFDSFREWFTMRDGDFAALLYGAELRMGTGRVEGVIGAEYSRSEAATRDREFVYQDDSPILQKTSLRRVPITGGLRVYPLPRGESLSQYAWVPRRISPFVGAGAGLLLYEVRQSGEFVDRGTLEIFRDEFETSGSAVTYYAQGGLDYWLNARMGLTTEGRYYFGSTAPDYPFEFDKVDLGGWQITAGLSLRF